MKGRADLGGTGGGFPFSGLPNANSKSGDDSDGGNGSGLDEYERCLVDDEARINGGFDIIRRTAGAIQLFEDNVMDKRTGSMLISRNLRVDSYCIYKHSWRIAFFRPL